MNDLGGTPAGRASIRELTRTVENGVKERTERFAFEQNGPKLWARVAQAVSEFLQDLLNRGALVGSTPEQGYFVKCGMAVDSQGELDEGALNIVVGFAPLQPAEFVILSIRQLTGQQSE